MQLVIDYKQTLMDYQILIFADNKIMQLIDYQWDEIDYHSQTGILG